MGTFKNLIFYSLFSISNQSPLRSNVAHGSLTSAKHKMLRVFLFMIFALFSVENGVFASSSTEEMTEKVAHYANKNDKEIGESSTDINNEVRELILKDRLHSTSSTPESSAEETGRRNV